MESQSRTALLHRLYQSTVAGSFPLPDGGNAMAIARGEAEEALDAPRVHMLLAIHDGHVFYIASSSREIASLPGFSTPLAAALPNHPAHVGDAAYRIIFGDFSAAVIRKADSLRLIVGYQHEVATSLRPEGEADIRIVECDDSMSVRLESEAWIYRSLADKIATRTGIFSFGVLCISLTLGLAAQAVSGYYGSSTGRSAAKLASEAETVLRSMTLTQPLGTQLVRVIELSKTTVETGGWIDSYVYSTKSGEAFTVSLPGWVTSDAIKKLGDAVSTHKQPKEVNLIWARKADKTGAFAPGPGPSEIVEQKPQTQSAATAPTGAKRSKTPEEQPSEGASK